ncbi:MAG: hypothetical protein LUQ27_03965 [Methanomassiliicoccales archaeon]|nr:hypothetical protein [Methanomassiliicoccales archaeon]
MFSPEEDLRRAIFEILGGEGKSISALSRELEGKGYNLHRLILTGYLRALTDIRILKEREVPPAKIYIPIKPLERDIYEVVGQKVREMSEGEKANALILYLLSRIFRRAIFFDELKKAGVTGQPPGRQASSEERQEAKRILVRAGFRIPDSSKAYLIEEEGLREAGTEILVTIVVESLDAGRLIRETTQTRLSP